MPRRLAVLLLVLLLLLLLPSCLFAPQGGTKEARTKADAAIEDCLSQLRSGKLHSYREAADCAGPQIITVYQASAYPFMDLVYLEVAARRVGAENIDRGAVSEEAVRRDMSELVRRLTTEASRREAAMKYGDAAPRGPGEATLLAGLSTISIGPMPTPGGNCFSVGSFQHCQ